jgi:hypothetical protein
MPKEKERQKERERERERERELPKRRERGLIPSFASGRASFTARTTISTVNSI